MKRYLVIAILLLGIAVLVPACAGDKQESEQETSGDMPVDTVKKAAAQQEKPGIAEEQPVDTLIDTLMTEEELGTE